MNIEFCGLFLTILYYSFEFFFLITEKYNNKINFLINKEIIVQKKNKCINFYIFLFLKHFLNFQYFLK